MASLTATVFILGVIAVVITWIVAVRLIKGDLPAGHLISPYVALDNRSSERVEVLSN